MGAGVRSGSWPWPRRKKDLESLLAEFNANGLHKELSGFDIEQHDDVSWNVFYVVAPDGLCYWFGERQAG